MTYFEKAIKNYSNDRMAYYAFQTEKDVQHFCKEMAKMAVIGRCPGDIECRFCPVRLAATDEPSLNTPCGIDTPQRRREIIAMEVRDEHS